MSVIQGRSKQRTCFACRKTDEKAHLLRLVVDDEGQIWPDFSAKLPGRGVYLCLEEKCIKALSDKKLQILKRDFSPQLPQWMSLRQRMYDMLGLRIAQLMSGMKRRSAIGRDAVMHRMWEREASLVMFASDAGDAVVRQVQDAVEKREEGNSSNAQTKVLVSLLDSKALGLVLDREKVSVVAFSWSNPVEKFQQLCVWQQRLVNDGAANKKESKVTNG